jgi:hypothetical protein
LIAQTLVEKTVDVKVGSLGGEMLEIGSGVVEQVFFEPFELGHYSRLWLSLDLEAVADVAVVAVAALEELISTSLMINDNSEPTVRFTSGSLVMSASMAPHLVVSLDQLLKSALIS